MKKQYLYTVSKEYRRYLKVDCGHEYVYYSDKANENRRPFLGIIIEKAGQHYYIPLTSPKKKHEKMKSGLDVEKIYSNKKLIGLLNINNMIPVSLKDVQEINIDRLMQSNNLSDRQWGQLIIKDINVITEAYPRIVEKANMLYDKYMDGTLIKPLRKRCLNFGEMEKDLKRWIQEKTSEVSLHSSKPKLKIRFSSKSSGNQKGQSR
ncbi:type III toxin-antitoxin system ToxN/AbiQ family toxin [Veillonella magna]|uniref:Type III toxin-antitoxin system ToxN/AbiQ family toxin n=1 Tax=Veillonella magna TaxID=464322 RepID=A0ABS2GFI9_9FIRM|nr:type III toxin-antitoxin system ToxN/AbiQ family toxin [Veillonella magna]MBM6823570.1 type III toxin-antitoxin system ToxN/AbiQ family toxin [Veillonella magna]MBM6911914.1 type III toxin-antitoxin system ToxN/AbiQ family toxin [Veillonella magna]